MKATWYISDGHRYHTGSGWSADRDLAKRYTERWLAVIIRRMVGGYIYVG